MKKINFFQASCLVIVMSAFSCLSSHAQGLNTSTNGSNLTTRPGSLGGPNWDLVGIGIDDPDLVRHLHIRDAYLPFYSPDQPYHEYTVGIRLDYGTKDEMPPYPVTGYESWDIANFGGNYQLYNVNADNIEFSILGNNGYTGIGTPTPQGRLDVFSGQSHTDALYVRANPATGGMGGVIHHQSHQYAWQVLPQNTAFVDNSSLRFHFTNRTSPGEKVLENILVLHSEGRVGIGTASPGTELDVVGTVRACEVLVLDAGWCDYVFDEDYKMMSLSELETYIDQNHHLPNIPTAEKVEEEGLELGDMVPRMMEKIEELTLYIIEQEKRINELEALLTEE